MAKADELGFNALIKPTIVDEKQEDIKNSNDSVNKDKKDDKSDIQTDNQIDSNQDNSTDIQSDKKQIKKQNDKKLININTQKDNKKDKQKNNQKNIKKSISKDTPESPMDILIASKKKSIVKKFVGLHLPLDVDNALIQFKKDTDIDKSEAVAYAIRLFLKDYFKKL